MYVTRLRMLQVGAGRRKCKEASEIHKFSTGSFDNDQDDLHHELKSKEPFAHYFLKKNERISETACYGKQVSFILDQV